MKESLVDIYVYKSIQKVIKTEKIRLKGQSFAII